MQEIEQGKSDTIDDLERLIKKIDKYTELLNVLRENISEAIGEIKGMDLSQAAKAEIAKMKEVKEIIEHLAKGNLIVVVTHMQIFLNSAERISDGIREVAKELIKIKSKLK